jgi:hypothetical protein
MSQTPPPTISTLPIAGVHSSIVDSLDRLLDIARSIKAWVEANREPIARLIDWAGNSWTRAKALEESGWLPHYTQPDDLFPPAVDAATAHQLLERHYRENWCAIEAQFQQRLDAYVFDEEAKACFREALTAHGHGLYRSVPRLLFPEIERLSREHLQELFVDSTVITSLREPRERAEDLGFSNLFRSGVFSLRIYSKFATHLYARVKTADELVAAQLDPVPNRHAALHGLVTYSSMQSSLNALIMAEFAMLTIDALRELAATEALSAGQPSDAAK